MCTAESKINCPKCDRVLEITWENSDLITYYGDEGPGTFTCEYCEAEFKVQEYVTRWWEVVDAD